MRAPAASAIMRPNEPVKMRRIPQPCMAANKGSMVTPAFPRSRYSRPAKKRHDRQEHQEVPTAKVNTENTRGAKTKDDKRPSLNTRIILPTSPNRLHGLGTR